MNKENAVTTTIDTGGFQVPTVIPTVVDFKGSNPDTGPVNCRPCSTASVDSGGQSWSGQNDQTDLLDDDSTRGPSPDPDSAYAIQATSIENRSSSKRGRHSLQVPSEHYGGFFGSSRKSVISNDRFCESIFEEESDLIRSYATLSAILGSGIRKSFSTSDICTPFSSGSTYYNGDFGGNFNSGLDPLKSSSSEVILSGSTSAAATAAMTAAGLLGLGDRVGRRTFNDIDFSLTGRLMIGNCLDYTSRSCSTWVAVGDMASTSQLPSPQGNPPSGGQLTDSSPFMLAAEFIRSVNKKVRQSYIKRRLMTTYKALERIPQNELILATNHLDTTMSTSLINKNKGSPQLLPKEILKLLRCHMDLMPHGVSGTAATVAAAAAKNLSLTAKDVDNEKGKPLSKFERNMIIFNWLHTLGDTGYDGLHE